MIMRYVLMLILFFISNYAHSQTTYIKTNCYEGYIFPKEHAIWGIPPENNRYTLNAYEIIQAEKILADSINSNCLVQKQVQWNKCPINKKTLKKYIRQYIGYKNERGEIVISINLYKNKKISKEMYMEDIIFISDGEFNYWSLLINISTKQLSDMRINGVG